MLRHRLHKVVWSVAVVAHVRWTEEVSRLNQGAHKRVVITVDREISQSSPL